MWNVILPRYSFLLICGYVSISIADYSFACLRAFSIIFQLYHTRSVSWWVCNTGLSAIWQYDNCNPNIMSMKFNWWLSMIPRISIKRRTISNLEYLVGIRVDFVLVFCVVFYVCLSSSCVMCTLWCQFHWIVHSWLLHRFSLAFIYPSRFKISCLNALRTTNMEWYNNCC